ncbi:copper chaperone PCu(A)C [Noviherbaspirillum aerium]|uniref:copper chaperone PCu(A)C n=1 Tax=Noviherbaspirillum aerium TaxID=2588497 RepID=UPI00124CE657|nr:copper chaperone PCu(A)C [Noviherbaspirillum aerium]
MKKPLSLIAAALLVGTSASAMAQIAVTEAWVRATVAQQPATGAFMRITAQQDARLVDVQSPIAKTVELHEMKMENNVMKMRPVAGIALPAGQAVELKPGGYHIMLVGLTRSVGEGDAVPLTLVVETADKKRESVSVQLKARSLSGASAASGAPGAASHTNR